MTDEEFINRAEEALAMTPDDCSNLRVLVSIELLLAHAGITNEQVRAGYEHRLRTEILNTSANLKSLL